MTAAGIVQFARAKRAEHAGCTKKEKMQFM